ncbi:MAG: hypothetical protein JWN70_4824 [Planctomycetaceae bacterium]|nr:hypothetical protein [Planctomycetaceae bacterium]
MSMCENLNGWLLWNDISVKMLAVSKTMTETELHWAIAEIGNRPVRSAIHAHPAVTFSL